MASQWFYQHEGEKLGPLTSEQLKSLAASKQIAPSDLVWKEGMAEWCKANRLKGLFPEAATVQSAPAPPPPSKEAAPAIVPAVAQAPKESIADRLKAAGQLVAKQAMRAKQASVTLPNGYRNLGRHLENTEMFKNEFPELFQRYNELKVRMASLADGSAARPPAEGFKAKMIAAAVGAKEMAQTKGREFQINSVLCRLERRHLRHMENRAGQWHL